MTVRLEWDGKPDHVERIHLPFQTVETINESRATRERNTGALFGSDSPQAADRNQLIWGDNKLVLSSLRADFAGQVDPLLICVGRRSAMRSLLLEGDCRTKPLRGVVLTLRGHGSTL